MVNICVGVQFPQGPSVVSQFGQLLRMDVSFSKLTVKDQVVCKYCGKVRAYAGMARHQRSKKCLEAKAKQVVERAKQELSNLEAEYQKELAQLKAKYRNRAKELQQIITIPSLPSKQ